MRSSTPLAFFVSLLGSLGCPTAPGDAEGNGAEGEGAEGEGEGAEGEGDGGGEGEGEGDSFCDSTDGLAIYERRIEPLVSGAVPTTCNQCHLSGVDLSLYVQDTPCDTMGCMVQQGEVSLLDPASSPILARLLASDPASNLIDADVIQSEHDGFLEWIEWNAQCFDGVCGVIDDPCNAGTGTAPPPDVLTPLGGCDEAALVASFDRQVFAWRGRCSSCHAGYGANTVEGPGAPKWLFGAAENPVGVDDARFTMFNVIGRGLFDRANPANSLLLLKPLDIEDHAGGKKFADTSDETYVDYLSFAEEYATCFPVDVAGEGEGEGEGEGAQAPVVAILHPSDGERRAANLAIPWRGDGDDPQQGLLAGASLVWTSSLSAQPFGTGAGFFDAPLPVGENVVTLTATDADGNVGSASITIIIE